MNPLLTLHQQPLFLTNLSPLHQSSQSLQHPPINTLSSKSWELHAQAKGFGNASKSKKENKITSKTGTNKGDNNDDDDDDDKIPQVVFDRIIRRILAYVGVPLALGVVLLQLFDIVKEKHLLDVPRWVPFVTTFLTFGSSVLGVAYGSLSTSWDPEKNGSLLGLEEARVNWVEMWKEEETRD